jgi:hypothetical protein
MLAQDHWWQRRLIEVECVKQVIGLSVSYGEWWQMVSLFHECQKGREFGCGVADVTLAGIRRND